jgi:hypothetical protein
MDKIKILGFPLDWNPITVAAVTVIVMAAIALVAMVLPFVRERQPMFYVVLIVAGVIVFLVVGFGLPIMWIVMTAAIIAAGFVGYLVRCIQVKRRESDRSEWLKAKRRRSNRDENGPSYGLDE